MYINEGEEFVAGTTVYEWPIARLDGENPQRSLASDNVHVFEDNTSFITKNGVIQ